LTSGLSLRLSRLRLSAGRSLSRLLPPLLALFAARLSGL
jgi:hypothetical protein